MKLILKQLFRYLTPCCLYALARRQMWRRTNPGTPWLTRQAIEVLQSWLQPTDVGLEWGSGRSTAWFAKRVSHLTSIEHEDRWYRRVKNALSDKGIDNVELLYVPLKGKDKRQPEYVHVAAGRSKASLDFVLVDGCFRDQCAEVGLQLLKPGGMLIIDDSARYIPHPYCCPQSVGARKGPPSELWAKVLTKLEAMGARSIWTSDGVSSTVLYIVPASKI